MDRIVLEKKGRRGIVLEPDGSIRSVRLPGYAEVGAALPAPWWAPRTRTSPMESFPVRRTRTPSHRTFSPRRFAAAATAVLVLVMGTGLAVYAAPVSYVSLDMNLGVSLTLNRFDRVIAVVGHDAESKSILDAAHILNLTYEQGVDAILKTASSRGLSMTGVRAIVAVASQDESRVGTIGSKLRESLQNDFDELGVDAKMNTDDVAVELVLQAHDLGVSSGKLELLRILETATGEGFVLEDWLHSSVGDILEQLDALGVDIDEEMGEHGDENESGENGPSGTVHPKATTTPKPTSASGDPGKATEAPEPTHGEKRPTVTPKAGEGEHNGTTPGVTPQPTSSEHHEEAHGSVTPKAGD